MNRSFLLSVSLLAAGCGFGLRLKPECAGLDDQLSTAKARYDEVSNPNWVPPAPSTYEWYCIGEPDYADRDALQEQRLDEFKGEFLQDEVSMTADLMQAVALAQVAPCNLITEADGSALVGKAKKLIADRLTASLKLVQKLPAPERYSYYWASIVTAVNVARQQQLLGADYEVFVTLQQMLAEQLNYYLDTELSTNHDLRYSPKALIELLKKYGVLGGDLIDIGSLGPRIAKALTFDYAWSQETRLFPNNEETLCTSEMLAPPLRVRHHYEPVRFVQTPLEYTASLTSLITTSAGVGTQQSPPNYPSDLHLSPRACQADPKFHITMTRWGPDTQTYKYVDNMGQTDTRVQSLTCHTNGLVVLQLLNLVDYDLEAQPEWKKHALMDEVWVMKPPLLNRQEQVVDTTWNQTASGVEMSVKLRLQVWHRPE